MSPDDIREHRDQFCENRDGRRYRVTILPGSVLGRPVKYLIAKKVDSLEQAGEPAFWLIHVPSSIDGVDLTTDDPADIGGLILPVLAVQELELGQSLRLGMKASQGTADSDRIESHDLAEEV